MSLISQWQECNRATLDWILARPAAHGFVDTKVHSITGQDYTRADGLRGPDFTYGWIQGRALEALVLHSRSETDLKRKAALEARAKLLFARLAALYNRDGHIAFLYDQSLTPVRMEGDAQVVQDLSAPIYTYSDCFAAKGLIAAAAQFDPTTLGRYCAYFENVIAAIRTGRFQMDEKLALKPQTAAAQKPDFGPKMIAMGACRLFEELGLPELAQFGCAFGQEILEQHFDPRSKLLRNVPGEDGVNAGHSIEFVGFSLSSRTLRACLDIDQCCAILRASFAQAYTGPGLCLALDLSTGAVLNGNMPWWSLPETLRAAAWAQALRPDPRHEAILLSAHQSFFTQYWRADHSFAYQTLGPDGQPFDFVPATPDLDPAYHTGLSLLAAEAAFSFDLNFAR